MGIPQEGHSHVGFRYYLKNLPSPKPWNPQTRAQQRLLHKTMNHFRIIDKPQLLTLHLNPKPASEDQLTNLKHTP